jgi:hypothetical protein
LLERNSDTGNRLGVSFNAHFSPGRN